MNKNYPPADTSCLIMVLRACYLQRLASWLNRNFFRCWRFHLPCVIAALLLSATDAPAVTITVTNGNDSGPGSLRRAIRDASSGDTINFAPSVTTVILTRGQLVIDKKLTITGPRATRLTVRRRTDAREFRIFVISTVTASISRLTISNGSVRRQDGFGGGILSAGVLTLTDCTISDNHAAGVESIGGNGGGVLNRGTMTITRCTISNNSATGDLIAGNGGGVLNEVGTMTITRCTISNNSATGENAFGSGGKGGGILNYSRGSVIITNSTISDNSCIIDAFLEPNSGGGGGVDNDASQH